MTSLRMTLPKAMIISVITLLGLAAACFLSYDGRPIEAFLAGGLLAGVPHSLTYGHKPAWWRLRLDPAPVAAIFLITALAKGMGTGSESGDRIARIMVWALSAAGIVVLFAYDVAVWTNLKNQTSARGPSL